MSVIRRLPIIILSSLIAACAFFIAPAEAAKASNHLEPSNLPEAGFDLLPVAIIAAALLLIGALLLLGGRHRRAKSPEQAVDRPDDQLSS